MDLFTLAAAKNFSGGGGSGSSIQPDYLQNDSTAADYIKNRPFYEEVEEITYPIFHNENGVFIGKFGNFNVYQYAHSPDFEIGKNYSFKVTDIQEGVSTETIVCEEKFSLISSLGLPISEDVFSVPGFETSLSIVLQGVTIQDNIIVKGDYILVGFNEQYISNIQVKPFEKETIQLIDNKYLSEWKLIKEELLTNQTQDWVISIDNTINAKEYLIILDGRAPTVTTEKQATVVLFSASNLSELDANLNWSAAQFLKNPGASLKYSINFIFEKIYNFLQVTSSYSFINETTSDNALTCSVISDQSSRPNYVGVLTEGSNYSILDGSKIQVYVRLAGGTVDESSN